MALLRQYSGRYQKVTEPQDGETYVFYTHISNDLNLSDPADRLLKAAPFSVAPPEGDAQKWAASSTDALSLQNGGEQGHAGSTAEMQGKG